MNCSLEDFLNISFFIHSYNHMYFVLLIMKLEVANFDLCEKSPPVSPYWKPYFRGVRNVPTISTVPVCVVAPPWRETFPTRAWSFCSWPSSDRLLFSRESTFFFRSLFSWENASTLQHRNMSTSKNLSSFFIDTCIWIVY